MTWYHIRYWDFDTQQYEDVEEEFHDSPLLKISAYDWAYDYAYSLADKRMGDCEIKDVSYRYKTK